MPAASRLTHRACAGNGRSAGEKTDRGRPFSNGLHRQRHGKTGIFASRPTGNGFVADIIRKQAAPPKTGPNALSFPNRRKRYAEQPKHVATAEKAGIRRFYPSFSKLFRSSISAGQRLSSGVSRISGMSSKRLSRAIKRKTVIPRKPSPRFR